MSKTLKDTDLLDVVKRTIEDKELKNEDKYLDFLEILADALTIVYGGKVKRVNEPSQIFGYTVCININDAVPEDGGIWQKYDPNIEWKDGKEIDKDR